LTVTCGETCPSNIFSVRKSNGHKEIMKMREERVRESKIRARAGLGRGRYRESRE
jgi:hypothetical protein